MELPPFMNYLGIEVVRKGRGDAEVALKLAPHHLNRRGVAHGGVITTLLDCALGAAVISSIPEAWWCATTSLSTQFIDGAGAGQLRATGQVSRRGKTVAYASGEVRDERNRLIASAHGTWHLWSSRPGASRTAGCVILRETGERIRVGKILAVGRNYADHVKEMNAPEDGEPVVFLMPTTALARDGATIRIPTSMGQVHHEVELVALIGGGGKSIPRDEALQHVLGFGVGLDLTLRDVQNQAKQEGRPWCLAKGFDDSAPVSSFVPRDQIGDGAGLAISLDVNGERRQDANTSQMMHSVADLIEYVSRWMTLERGDLLFTGTPAGVGPLAPGDRVEARLQNVGTLNLTIEAADE